MKFLIIILSLFLNFHNSFALNIIRDEETEELLLDLVKPILKAADIEFEDFSIYVVNDKAPNAFVINNKNIFITKGLIISLNDIDAVASVFAHEVGHIKENHILRSYEIYKNQTNFVISSLLLGALAFGSNAPDLGLVITSGGMLIGERNMLKYSREFEEAADKAAIKYLSKAYNSSIGLDKSFKYFMELDKLHNTNLNPYLSTHPLTSQRLHFAKEYSKNLPKTTNIDLVLKNKFKRIVTKLKSFTSDTKTLLSLYNDSGINSTYAKSIIYYRLGDITNSAQALKKIIDQEPSNSYLYELLGQFYFEYGLIDESIINYKMAHKLNQKSSFIKLGLANCYIEKYDKTNDKNLLNDALDLLKEYEKNYKQNDLIYKSLAIIYGKLGKLGKSNIFLAEEALSRFDFIMAKNFANKSMKYLEKNSQDFLRAQDIIETSILQKK